MAFKTNVVKVDWQVKTREKNSFREKVYLVTAESEETARIQVPEEETVVSVTRLDGGGDGT